MKNLITITHWLFPIFMGVFIGGLLFGNSIACIVGLVLLILDAIIGIALQYSINKTYQKDDSIQSTFNKDDIDEKIEACEQMFNKANILLYSEYNDFMFGIDLNGNKRPLSKKHNELVRKVLDSEIDIATACYLSIDDVIVSPWQYLKKSIQNEIISIYGSLTPYSAFVFLNDYYYENYNYILVIYKDKTTMFATLEKYKFSLY